MEDELTLAALRMALQERGPTPGLVHHSDRGVQYASGDYTDLLKDHQIRMSMSRKGNPYDNATCESFMKTLKYDEVHRIPEYLDAEGSISVFPMVCPTQCRRRCASHESPFIASNKETSPMSRASGPGCMSSRFTSDRANRVYFGKDGEQIIILLEGSGKKRQGAAIAAAQGYKARQKQKHRT